VVHIADIAYLHLVQRTGKFFTVTGYKRHCGAIIEQINGVFHLLLLQAQAF